MKWYKSIKFQFITCFAVFICAIVGVSAVIGIRKISQITIGTFSTTGIYLAEKAASIIDGDAFESLTRSLDKEDPFYEEIRLQLLQMKEFSQCQYLFTMSPPDGDFAYYIIDGSAPPDDEEEFSDLGDIEDISEVDAYLNAFMTHNTVVSDLIYQEDWGWLFSVYTPIFNSAGKMVGVVGCDFDGTYLHESILRDEIEQAVIAGVSIIIGLLLLLFFLRKIFIPIGKINAIVKEISLGEGDLTRRIDNLHGDELGNLAGYFNITLDKIGGMITSIKKEAELSFAAGNNLSDTMHKTTESINHITTSIHEIKQKASSQSASVIETKASMEQVTLNIEELNKNVEAQTESVTQSSSAIEQMLANVQSVTNTLVHNEKNVRELIVVSDEGRASLQKVSQDIQEIKRESEGLLQINSVMENIASQTNLLSMNAAIEAAHAGETGKGFAVVASEIRKLAVNSSDQSKTISDVLKKIKSAIDAITSSTGVVLNKFEDIEERMQIVSSQETNIRSAMEEQGKGSNLILEAVAKMNDLTGKVKKSAQEMYTSSKEVIQESRNLERVTLEITNGMNEMADGAEQINTAVEKVNGISKTNKECITSLSAEVSKFKVE